MGLFLYGQGDTGLPLIAPADKEAFVSQTIQFTAVAQDLEGHVITTRDLQWASTDSAIAIPDTTGATEAIATGSASITAEYDDCLGWAEITVVEFPTDLFAIVFSSQTSTDTTIRVDELGNEHLDIRPRFDLWLIPAGP